MKPSVYKIPLIFSCILIVFILLSAVFIFSKAINLEHIASNSNRYITITRLNPVKENNNNKVSQSRIEINNKNSHASISDDEEDKVEEDILLQKKIVRDYYKQLIISIHI